MATQRKRPKRRGTKFNRRMYVLAYRYAKDGMSNKQIAQALGTTGPTLARWCAQDEVLEEALEQGRDPGINPATFHDYIYQRLPGHLQELWEQVHEAHELSNGVERVEALLANGGKHARQMLFVHALATTNFNVSKAMAMLNVNRKSYENWKAADPRFAELLDELEFHKDNFFETAFLGRIAAGDTAAILHAVKSKLAHRGYSDKVVVEHSGTVHHEHTHTVDLAVLPLSTAARREVLEAVRKQREALEVEALPA